MLQYQPWYARGCINASSRGKSWSGAAGRLITAAEGFLKTSAGGVMEPASSLSSFSSSVSYSEADSLATDLGFFFFIVFAALDAFIAFTSFF